MSALVTVATSISSEVLHSHHTHTTDDKSNARSFADLNNGSKLKREANMHRRYDGSENYGIKKNLPNKGRTTIKWTDHALFMDFK